MAEQLNGQSSGVEELAASLQSRCPAYFKDTDRLHYQVNRSLFEAWEAFSTLQFGRASAAFFRLCFVLWCPAGFASCLKSILQKPASDSAQATSKLKQAQQATSDVQKNGLAREALEALLQYPLYNLESNVLQLADLKQYQVLSLRCIIAH